MALSLDSIYKPLSDFFLNHFKSDPENPIFFRFAKIGSVVSDGDFIDPHFPDQYSPALAREYFSEIVNNIPIEDSDGQNIFFTQNDIDETYRDRLLGPSIPFIPQGTTDEIKDSILNSFNLIKDDAIKDWNNIRAESSTGLMTDYRPSLAKPDNWYDKTKNELWTPQSFHVEETTVPASTDPPKFQLWKLRMDDNQLQNALPVLKTSEKVKSIDLGDQVLKMETPIVASAKVHNVVIRDHRSEATGNVVIRDHRMDKVVIRDHRTEPRVENVTVKRSPVNQNFHDAYWGLDVKKRVIVSQYIKTQAPTQPVKANSFSINFKYCVIDIDRPWLKTSFINNKTWFIPNTLKAQLTAKDNSGANISALPIAFVALKELNIEANWSETDIEISKSATDFGPFEVDSQIVNNKLSHEGIQIIGWLLQKMPDLPPNDPPQ